MTRDMEYIELENEIIKKCLHDVNMSGAEIK